MWAYFGRRLAFAPDPVDNHGVSQTRAQSAPLPVTLLALSVAVCLTSAASAGPSSAVLGPVSTPARAATADQRDAFEHLLAALTDAAKKLGQRLEQQALADLTGPDDSAQAAGLDVTSLCDDLARPLPLREALLNLPPPAIR